MSTEQKNKTKELINVDELEYNQILDLVDARESFSGDLIRVGLALESVDRLRDAEEYYFNIARNDENLISIRIPAIRRFAKIAINAISGVDRMYWVASTLLLLDKEEKYLMETYYALGHYNHHGRMGTDVNLYAAVYFYRKFLEKNTDKKSAFHLKVKSHLRNAELAIQKKVFM